MVEYADRLRSAWEEHRDGAALDVSQEMMRLTLSIAGKTLFDLDVESQAAEVGSALTDVMESFWISLMPFADLLERLPVGPLRRAKAARSRLDAIIYRMIAERRASGVDRGDLLSMLLLAHDEDDGPGMTDLQVRDEAMTIFLAGHETTANALTWTWYLVSQSREVERRLHEEVDCALRGRLPTVADIPALPFVERIVTEAMRLFPPAWIIGRRAIDAYPIGGYVAPARSIVVMSPWVTHRDARFFPEPERFDPDRWTPAFKAALPKFAYYPFGGGPRQCIGESFAWMELMLLVATIAQRWTLRLVPGHPIVPQPLVTLRTKHGMKMTLQRHSRPLLLFQRGLSKEPVQLPGGLVPAHDAGGPGHLAFAIDRADVPSWEARLHALGIAIESRVTWERGGVSVYFRDPDGRSVELATPGVWPCY
jgi:cytochrome P450